MDIKFDFDDILIVPEVKTHITSRYKDITLPKKLPLFTAPMDTVVDLNNKYVFIENKINVVFPRTVKYDNGYYVDVFYSFGFEDIDNYYNGKISKDFKGFHQNARVLIDVANGNMQKILDYASELKRLRPDVTIMVGNIANPETYRWYAKHKCVDFIRLGVGNGCFGRGTRILMSNGMYKNIEDVSRGDEIITMDGNIAKVNQLIYRGNKKVVRLKTSMSPKDTQVTPDHNYYVGNYNTNDIKKYGYSKSISNYEWLEIDSYDKNFTPLFPNSIKFNINNSFNYDLLEFAINKKIVKKYKTNIKSNYNVGYIFGTFLGDGNSRIRVQKRKKTNGDGYRKSTTGSIHWSFGLDEINIVNKLKQCLYDEFNLIPQISYKTNILKVSLYCKPLAHLLFEFGKRENKYLPEKYFVNDKNYLKGLSDGLIDSDGNNNNGRISFYNSSIKLIELYNIIQFLLYGQLPNSTTRKFNTSKLIKKSNIGYSSRNLLSPEKRKTIDNRFIINKTINITDNNENIDVFDLEIDDESHSFIANNCIVHNSGCLTTKQSGIGYPMASLIYETKQVKTQMELDGFENLPKIVADGGMKDYSDIIKALALGADYVMLGSILNKTLESCADSYLYGFKLNKKWAEYFFNRKYPVKKYFRGMSTKEAQKAMGKTKFKTSEGVVRFRKVEYKLSGWVENFEHYLRNAMSYSNCKTLEEFIGSCKPIQITPSGYNRFNK